MLHFCHKGTIFTFLFHKGFNPSFLCHSSSCFSWIFFLIPGCMAYIFTKAHTRLCSLFVFKTFNFFLADDLIVLGKFTTVGISTEIIVVGSFGHDWPWVKQPNCSYCLLGWNSVACGWRDRCGRGRVYHKGRIYVWSLACWSCCAPYCVSACLLLCSPVSFPLSWGVCSGHFSTPRHAVSCKAIPEYHIDVERLHVSHADVLVSQPRAASGFLPWCQLTIQDVFWDAVIVHAVDMTQPAQSTPPEQRVHTGKTSTTPDLGVGRSVFPRNMLSAFFYCNSPRVGLTFYLWLLTINRWLFDNQYAFQLWGKHNYSLIYTLHIHTHAWL